MGKGGIISAQVGGDSDDDDDVFMTTPLVQRYCKYIPSNELALVSVQIR